MKKKNIANLFFLVFCVLVGISCLSFFVEFCSRFIGAANEYTFLWYIYKFVGSFFVDVIQLITFISCILIGIEFVIKHSNASNFVRYTYEEYKEYREQKKAEKQAKKQAKMLKQKENLEKQLQEMEKTE